MVKIAGSFLKIQDDFDKIKQLSEVCDLIHYDVMDGVFTKKATLPISKMQKVTCQFKKPFDMHLMVKDLKEYIDKAVSLNPSYITFHVEAALDVLKVIDYIHSFGIKAGIALDLKTDVSAVLPYLKFTDLVLVMSVKAGAGGQVFHDVDEKINALLKYRKENNLSYLIEVDGGINDTTIQKVKDADIIVAGSFITNYDNFSGQVYKLKKALRNGFTLAELLGVIVILSIIGLIAVRVIDSNLKESRYDTCMVQKNNLIDAAKMVTLDYPELLPDALESQTISVQVLKDGGEIAGVLIKGGYIEDNFVNPMTDENYVDSEGGVDVIVTSTNGRDYKYEVSFGNPDEDCHK